VWVRAAVAALSIALICATPGGEVKVTTGTALKNKLASEASAVLCAQPVAIFEDSKKEQFRLSANNQIGSCFVQHNGERVLWCKGAGDSRCHYDVLPSEDLTFWHLPRQRVANPQPKLNLNDCKCASSGISEPPKEIAIDKPGLIRGCVEATNSKFINAHVRLLRLRGDICHFSLSVGGSLLRSGTVCNCLGLSRDCSSLTLGISRHCFSRDCLPFHLIDLSAQSVRLPLYLGKLATYGVGLPLGLRGKSRDILYGALDVAGIFGHLQSSERNSESSKRNQRVYRIEQSNLAPKRFLEWGLVFVGGALFSVGWLWLQIGSRLGLTMADAGWRGAGAIALVLAGTALLWHALPLVVP